MTETKNVELRADGRKHADWQTIAAENVANKPAVGAMTAQELCIFATEQGRVAAAGDDSLFMVCCEFMNSVHENRATLVDAGTIYLAYAQGKNTSLSGRKIDLTNIGTVNAQASKVAAFGRLHKDHATLPWVALDIVSSFEDGPSNFECVYRVLAAQNRRVKDGNGAMLTDDEIRALFATDEKIVGLEEWLKAQVKAATKYNKKYSPACFEKYMVALQELNTKFLAGELNMDDDERAAGAAALDRANLKSGNNGSVTIQ